MSWFDTKGLASLAKTALKEAQKQIDKALDIQDEGVANLANASNTATDSSMVAAAATTTTAENERPAAVLLSKKLPGGANRERSKTEPNTPVATPVADAGQLSSSSTSSSLAAAAETLGSSAEPSDLVAAADVTASTWGSFTGSYFDNPHVNANEMVTATAKLQANSAEMISTAVPFIVTQPTPTINKRQSVTSNSDSVELLSSPTSPCSALTSPSEAQKSMSTSVERITTPNTSEIFTPDSHASLPGSIVIIGSNEATEEEEEEDDSMSYNTVMDDTLTMMTSPAAAVSLGKQQSTASEDSRSSIISDVNVSSALQRSGKLCSSVSSSLGSSAKLFTSIDEAHFESQTVNSDSTQSFEEVPAILASVDAAKCDAHKLITTLSSSDHNSNDEMETTTSSDIEIISNPNGDSSSTNSFSRASPMKLKKLAQAQATKSQQAAAATVSHKKGHFREPSEVSILSSDDSAAEVDKLMLRISELNELLEAREMRLMEFGRQNAALQDRNMELQSMLDAVRNNSAHLEATEEYTQRLSALEKKFQACIRERDTMRVQLKSLKEELQSKIPKDELSQVVAESNSMINELKTEGEKLSKEILQQSNIIKKLRAKEKSTDALLKKNKDEIKDLTEEVERLKRTLNAKEEVERAQIEAVHKMSSEKRKLDEENAQQRSQIEDLESRLSTLQTSFEAAKEELQQRTRQHTDLTRSAEEAFAAQREIQRTQAESQELLQQLADLREKLLHAEQQKTLREQKLAEQNTALLRRCEQAETRAESLTQEASALTIPLVRQMESLQSTLAQRTSNWNKQEQVLQEKLEHAQTRLRSLENIETTCKEKSELLQTRCLELEEKLANALMQEEKSKIALQQMELDFKMKEAEAQSLNVNLSNANLKLNELSTQNKNLLEQLELLKRTEPSTHRALTTAAVNEVAIQAEREHQSRTQRQSPTLSADRNSVDEQLGGSVDWQVDDLETVSTSGRQLAGSVYGMNLSLSYAGHNTTTFEHLQALLKQRDGELSQLQWELSRLQADRDVLNGEISQLTLEMELIKDKLLAHESLEKNYNDLQHQYDALLQMYGEKVERMEELELDLLEAKEAYKAQIDELLAQPRKN